MGQLCRYVSHSTVFSLEFFEIFWDRQNDRLAIPRSESKKTFSKKKSSRPLANQSSRARRPALQRTDVGREIHLGARFLHFGCDSPFSILRQKATKLVLLLFFL